MRRLLAIALIAPALAALLVFGTGASPDDEGGYEVRAIFDNGAFLVPGVDVRVAGANVGSVAQVDVTGVGEAAHVNGSPEPGKAVAVLDVTDAAFQDFREDASCTVRPQSLLGDKFVECRPTSPRAPGSSLPPPLETIEDGEDGEGQYFLGLEQNGKAVDLDLVNNIMRRPYPDRFRLILNDLGAGLAARGDDIEEIIERGNPALRETDEVLAILAAQNRQLADLARDGDTSLQPLAAEREHIRGFINSAEVAAAATAERGSELESSFQKLPAFLRELRGTMTELDDFATQSGPVISDLGAAAPDLTRATEALEPFFEAATPALETLGDASEEVGPNLRNSRPVLRDLGELATEQIPGLRSLRALLSSFRRTGGFDDFGRLIFFATGALNGFDSYGHILRALVPVNNCYGYDITPESGCESFFSRGEGSLRVPVHSTPPPVDVSQGPEVNRAASRNPIRGRPAAGLDPSPAEPAPDESGEVEPPPPAEAPEAAGPESMEMLLDFLIGPQPGADAGGVQERRTRDGSPR